MYDQSDMFRILEGIRQFAYPSQWFFLINFLLLSLLDFSSSLFSSD